MVSNVTGDKAPSAINIAFLMGGGGVYGTLEDRM